MDRLSVGTGVDEIGYGVNKGMFVSDAVAGRPPVGYVGLHAIALRHQDVAESLAVFWIVAVVKFQAVHVFEIEEDGALAAIDFDFNVVAPTGSIASGLEVGHDAAFHPTDERCRIGHRNFAHFARALGKQIGARAFRDEGMDDTVDLSELADKMARQVNDMRIDIAMDAAAAGLLLEPPVERKFRVRQTVLRIARAEMVNAAQRAFANHSFGQCYGRYAPVIMADHVDTLGLFGRGKNGFALLQISAHRFFAEDVLAIFQRGNGYFGMGGRGRRNINNVNQGRFNHFTPVGGRKLPAKLGAGCLHTRSVAAADGVQLNVCLEVEEFGRLPPSVGVGAPHEFVTDQSYTQSFCHSFAIKVGIELNSYGFIVGRDKQVKSMSFTTAEIAKRLDGEVRGDETAILTGFATADTAKAGDLTFAESAEYFAAAEKGAATAVIAGKEFTSTQKIIIQVANPRVAFARALAIFFPEPAFTPGVHPSAVVAASAQIDPAAHIGPHCTIGERVKIGPNCVLQAGNFVGDDSALGEETRLFPNVTVYARSQIGRRVFIHAGTVIGSDGFGYVFDSGFHRKIMQIGNVIIGDDVEIGSNVSVDRGALGSTVIGKGTKIDNLVHVAHNVTIGEHSILCGQVGIAGSARLGNFCVLAGQVGIAGHLKIGNQVTVGSKSGVMHNIPDGQTWLGIPAQPDKQAKRMVIAMQRLPDLLRKVAEWEKKLTGS